MHSEPKSHPKYPGGESKKNTIKGTDTKRTIHKSSEQLIRKTYPCNIHPLKPHFYVEKLGYAGVHIFFLFLLQNIACGYLLEPPRRDGSNMYIHSLCFEQK